MTQSRDQHSDVQLEVEVLRYVEASRFKRVHELAEENNRLKRLFAARTSENAVMKDLLQEALKSVHKKKAWDTRRANRKRIRLDRPQRGFFLRHAEQKSYTTQSNLPTYNDDGTRHAHSMTAARALIMPPGVAGDFHCVSRCVRRSWLCGKDPQDGRDYEHRRAWIEDRIHELAEIFAVGIHAYAVMSNHVHLVIRVEPELTHTWTELQVAERGVALH